jgi:predicted DNA-binding protein
MSILTVRLSEEEKSRLARRAKAAGKTAGGLVRELIREEPFVTAQDLLEEIDALLGDKRLQVKPRK